VTVKTKAAVPQQSSAQTAEVIAVKWLAKPAKHDYPAARSFLMLNLGERAAEKIVEKLARTKCVSFKAKDLLRASGLPLLPRTNPDVDKELSRVAAGQALSPCLIIRGQLDKGRVAQIVDGYHRICASNYIDEDAEIPVQIIGL